MDRIMFRKAFSNRAYERIQESKYSSIPVIGSIKTRSDSDDDLENVLKERKEKTRAIMQSAISRADLRNRGVQSVYHSESNN